mmetsp:Transcript_38733/g.90940  ORF Transcript_38733/g.90940 Transcript_38733/m.90940 type:complete len:333 (-) Transcript_38733:48-1046(-)
MTCKSILAVCLACAFTTARATGGFGSPASAVPDPSRGADGAWAQPGAPKVPVARPRAEAVDAKPETGESALAPGPAATSASSDTTVPPPVLPESDGWEAQFAWGVYYSKRACLASESAAGPWASDWKGSRAGVPRQMLRAEDLLASAVQAAPQQHQRVKLAERALRLYYHAKWLAERNHATAAEWRYREASRLARQTRRNVLAAHSLGRLGYFLIHWRRLHEAKEALHESQRISAKSNPLAPYLLGLLERQDAGKDTVRILAAEELIINAGEQPSSDLEAERQRLMQVIGFWRHAETSLQGCFDIADSAYVVICTFSHLLLHVRKVTRLGLL